MPSLTVKASLLEDHVRPEEIAGYDAAPTAASPEVLEWFRRAARAATAHRDLRDIALSPDTRFPTGSLDTVEMILCSASAMENIFGHDEHILGAHQISVPDGDPFREDSGEARAYRILISWDPDRILALLAETARDDAGDERMALDAMSWLTTVTHELQHVRLFAENCAFNSPADVDLTQDDTGHDLFDVSTGYGIRALDFDGMPVWAEDCDEARDMMEEYVEERGRRMAWDIFTGSLSPESFLALLTPVTPCIPEAGAIGANTSNQPGPSEPENRLP